MEYIAIRNACRDDAASIALVHRAAVNGLRGGGTYDDELIDAWARPRTLPELRERIGSRRFFIAETPIEPVAYVQLDLCAAAVRSLYVAPPYWRSGVGRRLAQTVLDTARDAGLRRLELDSSLNAVPFYEALGFSRLESVDHRLPGGVSMSCIRMGRDLPVELAAAQR